MLTPKESQNGYRMAYRSYWRAKKRNDPLMAGFDKLPNQSDYGLTGEQGDWLAKQIRSEVEKELEGQ